MNITIQLDITSVKAMQTQLSTQMIPVAFARALNKTAQSAQSTALKIIAQAIGTPQKVIKPFLSRRLAQRQQLTAVLSAPHSRRLPLFMIDPHARQNQRGVMVRGKGLRRQLDHAFIAVMMKNGHRGIYARKSGAARLPIRELQGPSVARVFQQPVVQTALHATVDERWSVVLDHELNFALHQRGYRR